MPDQASVTAALARWRATFVTAFVALLAIKLVIACTLAPFGDEAFYWQESRHLAFYASQARDRLAASRKAQVLTRMALKRFWAPVGSGIEPRSETAFVLQYLMGGPEGAKHVSRIDTKVDGLPGLAGLGLVRKAVAKYGVDPTRAVAARSGSLSAV